MSNKDNACWRELQLEPRQWANMPESAGLWTTDRPDDATEARLRLVEEMNLILQAVLVSALTPRQRQVLELYLLEDRTQVEVAQALGISQATVSQHLSGKRRGTGRVGGAFRRVRKAIHKAAVRRKHEDTRSAQIIHAMDQLLDRTLTRRQARSLLEALARSEKHGQ